MLFQAHDMDFVIKIIDLTEEIGCDLRENQTILDNLFLILICINSSDNHKLEALTKNYCVFVIGNKCYIC
uniref:Uncharacterized protein n=1 Tax=viral metagenome TaxID=1070528 RepID=A0A6C0CB33_9ZZZZ